MILESTVIGMRIVPSSASSPKDTGGWWTLMRMIIREI